mmetsp:Transcript_38803/g.62642  ORF Transcript_38803/g.62642 Transcript_38803/m.62642 type:complete len:210 (+) Transcript_38803:1364-1993(+)
MEPISPGSLAIQYQACLLRYFLEEHALACRLVYDMACQGWQRTQGSCLIEACGRIHRVQGSPALVGNCGNGEAVCFSAVDGCLELFIQLQPCFAHQDHLICYGLCGRWRDLIDHATLDEALEERTGCSQGDREGNFAFLDIHAVGDLHEQLGHLLAEKALFPSTFQKERPLRAADATEGVARAIVVHNEFDSIVLRTEQRNAHLDNGFR